MSERREMLGGYFVPASSYVDDGAVVGRGTLIWHFCHVNRGAVIGERCSLGQNVVVMPGTRLGKQGEGSAITAPVRKSSRWRLSAGVQRGARGVVGYLLVHLTLHDRPVVSFR